MKLNKPIITIAIIILLGLNLIFFSFVQISKNTIKKDFLYQLADKFDLKICLLEDKNIKASIENYKYPKEVFDYIDNDKAGTLKKNFINNLTRNKDALVSRRDIEDILNNSVYEYENYSQEDAYEYVKEDIYLFSSKFESYFSQDLTNVFSLFKFFSNDLFCYASIIISLILAGLIIFFEKRNGYLITSIICFVYSLILYYLDSYFVKNMLIGSNNNLYLSNLEELTISLDNLYIICFIFSFVLLLIYIIKCIKKIMRDIRLSSYEKSWR